MPQLSILDIKARQILNSRGVPAVEVDLITSDGVLHRSSAPSGASTGSFEALDLYDNEKAYNGKGVTNAVKHVNTTLRSKLVGKNPTHQTDIDREMMYLDGTKNKSNLGANAILAVSMAVTKAGAHAENMPLYKYIRTLFSPKLQEWNIPTPMFNIVNGGAHADNNIAIQEFMVVPKGIRQYEEQLRTGAEIYYALKSLLKERGLPTGIGDEGGFAPNINSDPKAIELILEAIAKAGYVAGKQIFIGIDVAISQFAKQRDKSISYHIPHQGIDGSIVLTTGEEIIAYYKKLVDQYPIFSIEDGLSEDDWTNWTKLSAALKAKSVVSVGDDFTVTNPLRFSRAITDHGLTGIIIKPNQIGTITEVLEVARLASKHNIVKIASHRSGETGDTFISHLAVGINAQFLKDGATARSERVEKYNELLRINEELNQNS